MVIKCPVCEGKGTVHTGFYGTGNCSTRDLMEDKFRSTCRSCGGKGVIYIGDPETLPIVQELRKQLAKVTAERDALKSNPPVKVDSDAFELAARLAEVTAERDDLKKNARPVVRGEWEREDDIFDDLTFICSACHEPWILIDGTPEDNNMNFCPNCGADMRGDPK